VNDDNVNAIEMKPIGNLLGKRCINYFDFTFINNIFYAAKYYLKS